MDKEIESIVQLLAQRIRDNVDAISTGQGIYEQQDSKYLVDPASADGFPKDPQKAQEEHEDRLAEKTADQNKEMFEKVLKNHRLQSNRHARTQTSKIVEQLTGLNNNMDKLISRDLNSNDLMERLVDQTKPQPRKIVDEIQKVEVSNLDDIKMPEKAQAAKLTPTAIKKDGMDWMKLLLAGGVIAAIIKNLIPGNPFNDLFNDQVDPGESKAVYGSKWLATLLSKMKINKMAATGIKALINPVGTAVKYIKGRPAAAAFKSVKGFLNNSKPVTPKPGVGPFGQGVKGLNPKEVKQAATLAEQLKTLETAGGAKNSGLLADMMKRARGGDLVAQAALKNAKLSGSALKHGLRFGAKQVPWVGSGVNVAVAEYRRYIGDTTGMYMDYASAALNASSVITGPVGWGLSMAVDAASLTRDIYKSGEFERMVERNTEYGKRINRMVELLPEGKSPDDLTTDELKEIVGEDKWKEYQEGIKNGSRAEAAAKKRAKEYIADKQKRLLEIAEDRTKEVDLLMQEFGPMMSVETREAARAEAIAAALSMSEFTSTQDMRNAQADTFLNAITLGNTSDELRKEYLKFTKDNVKGQGYNLSVGPGTETHRKGNIKMAKYGMHYELNKHGEAVLVNEFNTNKYMSERRATGKFRDYKGTRVPIMERTGARLEDDSEEYKEMARRRNEYMAPKIGEHVVKQLKKTGMYQAYLMSREDLKTMTDEQVATDLGAKIAKSWTYEHAGFGQEVTDILPEDIKLDPEFMKEINEMADGIRTGRNISLGRARGKLRNIAITDSAGYGDIDDEGNQIYTGYIATPDGKIHQISDIMSGGADDSVRDWFAKATMSPAGTIDRSKVDAMNHELRRKIVGYEKMDSDSKRRFDEYWKDTEAAVARYNDFLSGYMSAYVGDTDEFKLGNGDRISAESLMGDDKSNLNIIKSNKSKGEREQVIRDMLKQSGAGLTPDQVIQVGNLMKRIKGFDGADDFYSADSAFESNESSLGMFEGKQVKLTDEQAKWVMAQQSKTGRMQFRGGHTLQDRIRIQSGMPMYSNIDQYTAAAAGDEYGLIQGLGTKAIEPGPQILFDSRDFPPDGGYMPDQGGTSSRSNPPPVFNVEPELKQNMFQLTEAIKKNNDLQEQNKPQAQQNNNNIVSSPTNVTVNNNDGSAAIKNQRAIAGDSIYKQ